MRRILMDSGILLSYYQRKEPLHQAVVAFFDQTGLGWAGDPWVATVMPVLGVQHAARST